MNITTIITAILGCSSGILAGILAYIKFFAERKDKRDADRFELVLDKKIAPVVDRQQKIVERLENIENHNLEQDKERREIRLDTLRTQMYIKMNHEPHNHDTILKIAEQYFCIYHGDWIATVDFLNWAEAEGVKIPKPVLDVISLNEKK